MQLDSINPKNNQIINSWDVHSDNQVSSILDKANNAYLDWKKTKLSFSYINMDVRNSEYFLLTGKHKRSKLSKFISKIKLLFK